MPSRNADDPRLMGVGGVDPGPAVKDRSMGFGSGRPEVPLPPDASSTLFVEGLPANCTRREVARILYMIHFFKKIKNQIFLFKLYFVAPT